MCKGVRPKHTLSSKYQETPVCWAEGPICDKFLIMNFNQELNLP